jgi:mono/diheme cytochrome c family protein
MQERPACDPQPVMQYLFNRTKTRLLFIGLFLFASVVLHAESQGEKLYLQNCAVCHAADGNGAMPGVPDLAGSPAWSKLSDKELLVRVKQGIQKPGAVIAMPPKGGNAKLTDGELTKIILYIRATFSK